MVQIDMDMPKSCFWCRKRKCLHIDGRIYQMCGLNEDGYLTKDQLKLLFKNISLDMDEDMLDEFFQYADKDTDGKINVYEFMSFMKEK